MTPWERKIWTNENLTLFVTVLITTVVVGALTLVGWCINLLGGFDWIARWMNAR